MTLLPRSFLPCIKPLSCPHTLGFSGKAKCICEYFHLLCIWSHTWNSWIGCGTVPLKVLITWQRRNAMRRPQRRRGRDSPNVHTCSKRNLSGCQSWLRFLATISSVGLHLVLFPVFLHQEAAANNKLRKIARDACSVNKNPKQIDMKYTRVYHVTMASMSCFFRYPDSQGAVPPELSGCRS